MTSPRADRDLLMNWASRMRWPVAEVVLMRSLPARSHRHSRPEDTLAHVSRGGVRG